MSSIIDCLEVENRNNNMAVSITVWCITNGDISENQKSYPVDLVLFFYLVKKSPIILAKQGV